MTIKELFTSKKIKMSDVVSPTPSRAASKAVDQAMKRASEAQKAISLKAANLRSR